MTPVAVSSGRLPGSELLITDHVQGAPQPDADSVTEYGVPTVATGSMPFVSIEYGATASVNPMLFDADVVRSVIVTFGEYGPNAVGVPAIRPVVASMLRPGGRLVADQE